MTLTPRLLGLAFAAADALVEVDEEGVVRFALGSAAAPGQQTAQWVGKPLGDRLSVSSAAPVARLLADLRPGERSPAMAVLLDCGDGRVRRATLRAFALPDIAPARSCALSYEGPPLLAEDAPPLATRLAPDADGFLAHARSSLSGATTEALQRLALAFIDISGLEGVDEATLARIHERIGAIVGGASHDGTSAGRLTASRYALIRDSDDSRDLAAEMQGVGMAEGVNLSANAAQAALGGDAASALRAMRFAIESCLKDGGLEQPELSFAESLRRTLKDADRFRAIVRDREFDLFYQPIVDLKTRAVHHFEALARFSQGSAPAPAIRMAEELALIEGFDLAVAERAIKRLRAPGGGLLKIAINVSGASLANDAYVAALLRMTAPDDRRRLMVEVTETAALADLAAADRRLGALRDAGVKICIDDFGAGSASFDYLRGLSVDAVKIDGGFVRDIDRDPRARTLITHLVELCGALKLQTIGEMIETDAVAEGLGALGVTHGQGWLFGRAEAEPRTILSSPSQRARRQGVIEAWT
ncbi:EAL domain-containing protein [Brevundimonas naejangsanensis]|uniref:EAL domain-containing protein n=1 Tax=Brevundimonas naejangsanensis TaxID=588932 RepID=A0A494RPE9_9CAUL|nr:EAL domain-containing protein [Brevundimonas naejangsanensis]AYG95962.1 EAL domain-containing protein [Brevundimonas naejangsanensis]